MPFPGAKYPPVMSESDRRVLDAAKYMLSALQACVDFYGPMTVHDDADVATHDRVMLNAIAAIHSAEGRIE
jgi:hypothetical protein